MIKHTILLVEDNPDDAELALDAFRQCGVADQVEVLRDGAAALSYLFGSQADSHSPVAVVILDLKLPKVNGLEVLHRIRTGRTTRYLPVVILTSSTEERDLVASYELGASSYLRKPVDFDQFLEVAGQLVRYWLLLNLPAPAPDMS